MYTFIEGSIRGGISQISKRFAEANHKNCEHYDPMNHLRHLIYLDANNLYGWVMSQHLPTNDFRWLTREEIAQIDINSLDDETNIGYILEVDMNYPRSLHERLSLGT